VSCINLNKDITFAIRAGDSLPLVERYEASLRWLLDIAAGAIPEERGAIDRLRRALARLIARRGARVAARDLKIALGGVFEAIERDLGSAPPVPKFAITRVDRSSRPHALSRRLVENAEWGLALGAGDWIPLFQRHRPVVEWLLDVAQGTTSNLVGSRQREAIGRVRAAIREVDDPVLLVDRADLRCVATLVLVALERDLGPVGLRPRGRFVLPTAAEVFGAGLAELFRAAGRRVGKAVAP
jgi:hypothetical protein